MNAKKEPHVGFPEVALHTHATKLVEAGYKVVVVEQVETVDEAMAAAGKKSAGVKRGVCEIYTQGTLVNPDMVQKPEAQYLLVLRFDDIPGGNPFNFSCVFVDCTTAQFMVGRMEDHADRAALRMVVAQMQPKEVVYCPKNTSTLTLKLLRNLPRAPKLSAFAEFPSPFEARAEWKNYLVKEDKPLPEALKAFEADELVKTGVAGAIAYLRSVLLDKQVVSFATWSAYDPYKGARRMILDSAALQHLEILQTQEGEEKGSVFHHINHTKTKFGARLLKRWICSPLFDPEEINARLDVVDYFIRNNNVSLDARGALSKLPDMERMMARVCAQALQSQRGAVMYSDVITGRLKSFIELLEAFDSATQVTSCFKGSTMPDRLRLLTTLHTAGGLFPDITELTAMFRARVQIVTDDSGNQKYRPAAGAWEDYDASERQAVAIRTALGKELSAINGHIGGSGQYIHTKGLRYQIECPAGEASAPFRKKVEETSGKQGVFRFYTPRIKELVVELEKVDVQQTEALFPFVASLFGEFHQHHQVCSAALALIAEIDALISLSIASQPISGNACRPTFLAPVQGESGKLALLKCRHPVQEALQPGFVPNDTFMSQGEVAAPVLLVTGPNMGGKSTVLRQTCLAVIMAQVGCYVYADACEMTPVDQIFTRVGAQDAILEGKSTFLVELEETAHILAHATPLSLAVIDELGRGTSTFDGTAIAMSVLEDIAHRINCRAMFATHYHVLCDQFAEDSRVAQYHMAAHVDEATGNVTFLYKFKAGSCPKSHGMNVARLAGLHPDIVAEAAKKAREFEEVTTAVAGPQQQQIKELLALVDANDREGLQTFLAANKLGA
mmetsp:Transcript_15964/g.36562  ORF Transcript_15964/g.36562 Transcript_15964/m.36562 type:complete len:843 (+) Transcript_15964:70-2598(+)